MVINQSKLKDQKANDSPQSKDGSLKPVKYRVKELKPDFLSSGKNAVNLLKKINELLILRHQQEEMDRWYNEFIAIYHFEMDNFYKKISDTPRTLRNYYISRKEWWNDTLDALSKSVHTAEKTYLSVKKRKLHCTEVKRDFLAKQALFDKEVKRMKRRWQ